VFQESNDCSITGQPPPVSTHALVSAADALPDSAPPPPGVAPPQAVMVRVATTAAAVSKARDLVLLIGVGAFRE
jgi:hypothetical protein